MEHSTGDAYEADALGRRNNEDLLKLRHGWDEVYDISVQYPRSWRARRHDGAGQVLTADSADALRRLIIDEYTALPRREAVSDD